MSHTPPSLLPPFPVRRKSLTFAFGNAGIALFSSFIALGALFGESDFDIIQSVFFSLFCFALPGQLVAAELFSNGAGLFAIAFAVWLVNCRLFPMTVVLLLLLTEDEPTPRRHRKTDFFLAHMVAVTSWVHFLATYRSVPVILRREYFRRISVLLWLGAGASTAFGHFIGSELPHDWLVGLLFLNPVYFLCMMLRSLLHRRDILAFFTGMILLPVFHLFAPELDIIAAGVIAGGIAYFYTERKEK